MNAQANISRLVCELRKVTLGVMDGLPELETVSMKEFPQAKIQHCTVHVTRNVQGKLPKKFRDEVAFDLCSIFYAPSKQKTCERFDAFRNRWQKALPSAADCLERSIDSCLTFFSFPEEEWISLRTTNIIERLNNEFRRRTRPMEALTGW